MNETMRKHILMMYHSSKSHQKLVDCHSTRERTSRLRIKIVSCQTNPGIFWVLNIYRKNMTPEKYFHQASDKFPERAAPLSERRIKACREPTHMTDDNDTYTLLDIHRKPCTPRTNQLTGLQTHLPSKAEFNLFTKIT